MSKGHTLSHDIAVALRTDILRQRYQSGDRLPSERDLAVRFSASRGAVREAISQLEQLGLIQVQPGGARVQPLEAASIAILGPMLGLDEQPSVDLVDQFLQTFGALVSLTTREAVAKATPEEHQRMLTALAELKKYRGDFSSTEAQSNWLQFLEYLTTVSNNLVVKLIGNDLRAQFIGQMLKSGMKPALSKATVSSILKRLDVAIKDSDKNAASRVITEYFDELRLASSQALESRQAG